MIPLTSSQEYLSACVNHPIAIQSLGIVSDEFDPLASQANQIRKPTTSLARKTFASLSFHTTTLFAHILFLSLSLTHTHTLSLSLRRSRGSDILFGHPNWELVQTLMLGIRRVSLSLSFFLSLFLLLVLASFSHFLLQAVGEAEAMGREKQREMNDFVSESSFDLPGGWTFKVFSFTHKISLSLTLFLSLCPFDRILLRLCF
jgi:hypothetical protein